MLVDTNSIDKARHLSIQDDTNFKAWIRVKAYFENTKINKTISKQLVRRREKSDKNDWIFTAQYQTYLKIGLTENNFKLLKH